MVHHSSDGQFEMAMVLSSMCKSTVGAMARLVRVIRVLHSQACAFMEAKARQAPAEMQTLAVKSMSCYHRNLAHCLTETQSVRQAVVALSSGESEYFALNMGCAAGVLVMKREIFSYSSSARGTTKGSGVERIKHMDTRHLWSPESLRRGFFRLNVINTSMITADMGSKYLSASHNEESVVGIDASVLRERRHRLQAQRLQRMRRCTMQ